MADFFFNREECDVRNRTNRKLITYVIAVSAWAFLLVVFWTATAAAEHGDEGQLDQQRHDAIALALQWMVAEQQNEDGGYGVDFTTGEAVSNVGATLDAVIAMAAAGHQPGQPYAGVQRTGVQRTPVNYLSEHSADLAAFASSGGGAAGKALMALSAARQDPRDFEGQNLVLGLTQQLREDGNYNADGPYSQALALLGLAAVNEPAEEAAIAWLLERQVQAGELEGSWDDGYGTDGSADTTALAIMALVAHGRHADHEATARARDFLARAQLENGAWEYGPGYGANGNSTALAIQALIALGEDVYFPESSWARGGHSPLMVLLAWQNLATGAFQADFGAGPFDDFYTTVQAIPAAAGLPFPLPSEAAVAMAAPALESPPTQADRAQLFWVALAVALLLVGAAAVYLFSTRRALANR
jgi:hypothetical protein